MFKYLLYFLSSVVILANVSPKSTQLFNQANEVIAKYNGEVNGLKEAREILTKLTMLDPQSADTLLIKGKLIFHDGYINHHNYRKESIDKAKDLCQKIMKKYPQRIDTYILLAALFMNDGTDIGLDKAKSLLNSADSINKNHIRLKLIHVQLAQKYKNNDAVIRLSNEILVLNPKTWQQASAYSFLSIAYWRIKDFDKAKSAYLKIIELEPSSPWALINYSSFLRKRKDFDGAILYAKKSLKLADYGMGWSVLSKAYYAKGHYLYWGNKDKINSKKWFQLCVDINPNSLNCHYGLGSSYFHTGWINHSVEDIKRSQKEYNECQRINPRHESSVKELKKIQKLLKSLGVR